MGAIGNCCCNTCAEPPEIEIDGLTESTAWIDLGGCCWEKKFTYDAWPIFPIKYTSPTISDLALEFKGRRTIVADVGTVSGATCVSISTIDVAYYERWTIYEDAFRKYAYINPQTNEVVVKAYLVEIIELGVPVLYWLYSITEGYTATYGFDRKFRSYNDSIRDSISCATWTNGLANVNDPTYASVPTSSWSEQTPIASGAVDSSTVFAKVKVLDLESLAPCDWLEQVISTTDADTPSVAGCIDGVQDPFSLAYSLSPTPACSQIEVVAGSCGQEIDTTGNVIVAPDFMMEQIIGLPNGASAFFAIHLRLNSGCCIDDTSVCNYTSSGWGGTPQWDWSAEAEIITSNCTSIYDPMDMIVHPVYTVRWRLPCEVLPLYFEDWELGGYGSTFNLISELGI